MPAPPPGAGSPPPPGPPQTPDALAGTGLGDDLDQLHHTADEINALNDNVKAAEDGLNSLSAATSGTAALLPPDLLPVNATDKPENLTGCFVEYIGDSWSSKSAELRDEEEEMESEQEDTNRMAEGTVMGIVYLTVGVFFLFFGAKFFKTVLFTIGFTSAGGTHTPQSATAFQGCL